MLLLPLAKPTACIAASSRLLQIVILLETDSKGVLLPKKHITTGLFINFALAIIFPTTACAGGLDIKTIILVESSAVKSSKAVSVVKPPTLSDKSRPPVPIAWLIPSPRQSIRVDTCWIPVPEAPTSIYSD